AKTAARHEVVFRKKLTLAQVPSEGYATLLASQRAEAQVNGREAKAKERDGAHYGRITLFDLKPLLVAGENVITINVSSHTEKGMNDIEKKQYPASMEHLNKQSGLAFYLGCLLPGVSDPLQITSDETRRMQRKPR